VDKWEELGDGKHKMDISDTLSAVISPGENRHDDFMWEILVGNKPICGSIYEYPSLCQAQESLNALINEIPSGIQWRETSQQLPECGKVILGYHCVHKNMGWMQYDSGINMFRGQDSKYLVTSITHWMPQPIKPVMTLHDKLRVVTAQYGPTDGIINAVAVFIEDMMKEGEDDEDTVS